MYNSLHDQWKASVEMQRELYPEPLTDVHEGMVLDQRFLLGSEIDRTERYRVFRMDDALHSPPPTGGITIYFDEQTYLQTPDVEAWSELRYSDFGSPSRRKIATASRPRGGICLGWSGYDRGIWYLSWSINRYRLEQPNRSQEFTSTVRKVLLQAAQGKCQACGAANALEYDHVVPVALGGTGDVANGMLLCRSCHNAKTRIQVQRFPLNEIERHLLGNAPYSIRLHQEQPHFFATSLEAWTWIALHVHEFIDTLSLPNWQYSEENGHMIDMLTIGGLDGPVWKATDESGVYSSR